MREYVAIEGMKYKVDKEAIDHYNNYRLDNGEVYLPSSVVVRQLNAIISVSEQVTTINPCVIKVFFRKMKLTVDIEHNIVKYISCFGDKNEKFINIDMDFNIFKRLKEAYLSVGLNNFGNKLMLG